VESCCRLGFVVMDDVGCDVDVVDGDDVIHEGVADAGKAGGMAIGFAFTLDSLSMAIREMILDPNSKTQSPRRGTSENPIQRAPDREA